MLQNCLKKRFSDLDSRHEIRKSLKCHDFEWFLDNVMKPTELLPIFDFVDHGELKNNLDFCLDFDTKLDIKPCHGHGLGQYWMLTTSGFLRRDFHCLISKNSKVEVELCNENSNVWKYSQNQLMTSDGLCLASNLSLEDCHDNNKNQLWYFSTENS